METRTMYYTPHDWETGQTISEGLLDNMEAGINSAHVRIDGLVSEATQQSAEAIKQIREIMKTFQEDSKKIEDNLASFRTEILNAATEKNNEMFVSVGAALGSNYYDSTSKAWKTINENNQDVSTRLTSLYNAIFGTGMSSSTKTIIEQLKDLNIAMFGDQGGAAVSPASSRLTQLQNEIYNAVGPILGDVYYTTNSINLGINDSIDTRLTTLYDSIFGASGTGSSKTLVEQIQELNTAIFGSSEGGATGGSLIDKIETALGRELEPTTAQIEENSNKGYSLLALIEQIQGVLGINGQTSSEDSDLVTKINNLIKIIYGEEEDNDHTLPELYSDFYDFELIFNENKLVGVQDILVALMTAISSIRSISTETKNTLDRYTGQLDKIDNAFVDVTTQIYGDNNYLILKSISKLDTPIPETLSGLEESNLKYVKLPAGGGGGGMEYQYIPSIIDVEYPNSVMKVGDPNKIKLTWKVTDGGQDSPISGTLRIRINQILFYSEDINSNEPLEYDLGPYITTTGRKNVVISISSEVAPTRSLYPTITAYQAALTLDLDTKRTFTGSNISIPYLAAIGSSSIEKTLHILIDGIEVNVNNNIATSEEYISALISTPSLGAHLLTAYFEASPSGNFTLTSNIINLGIICGDINESYIATNLNNTTDIIQYDTVAINYMVGSNRTDIQHTVAININGIENFVSVSTFEIYTYNYTCNNVGTINITFTVDGNVTTSKHYQLIVARNEQYNFELQRPQNLVLNLTPEGRNNQELVSTINTWTNSATGEDAYTSTVTMENFLFSGDYDGWLQDENNKPFLRLRNTDRVIIDNCPLLRQPDITTGLTFEIEFKAHDVADISTEFFTQVDTSDRSEELTRAEQNWARELEIQKAIEDGADESEFANEDRPYKDYTEKKIKAEYERIKNDYSIHLSPQALTLYAQTTTKLQYKEDELTTISYVINPIDASVDSGLIYGYINGVLSSIKRYSTILAQKSDCSIVIGSSDCTLDIYAIRFYQTALSPLEVVKNWIYGISDVNKKTAAYTRNNYSTFNYEDYISHSPNTPYLIIKGNGPLMNSDAMPQSKGSSYARDVTLTYTDPLNAANSFSTGADTTIQVQGTSSQYYIRKNYKIKMKSFLQNGITHKKGLKDNEINDITTNEGYKLYDESIPVFDFCLKADYASSEGVNNTGLARLYDNLSRSFFETVPQQQDSRIRQAVDGRPIIVFYQDGSETPENNGNAYFLGKYNFNNDKGTHEVFGLTTFQLNCDITKVGDEKIATANGKEYLGDQSWEGADNFFDLDIFNPREAITTDAQGNITNIDQAKWTKAWPARFPGDWEDFPSFSDYRDFAKAVKWVYDNRTEILKQLPNGSWKYATHKEEYDAGGGITAERLAKYDSYFEDDADRLENIDVYNAHLQTFKTEFTNYFDLQAMLFFYVFTEFFLMVDNRAKNTFFTRYLTTANRDATAVLNASEQTYGGWFTLPYDFDTAMGINNEGTYEFDYHYEDGEFQDNGALVYNGQPSLLWSTFKLAFKEEIENEFRRLLARPNFSYDSVESFFENHQSAWSETVFNEDARFKYIIPRANYDMAQGSKKEQRQWWLYNRFRYVSSRYLAGSVANDYINMRADAVGIITATPYADCYITFSYGSGDQATPITKRAIGGERVVFDMSKYLDSSAANDAVVNIYPASAIKEISGLASCKLRSIDFSSYSNNTQSKIQTLQLGSPNSSIDNSSLATINLARDNILRHVDIRNCSQYTSTLDLTMCNNLIRVYGAGTRMSSIGLPDGGILETVQYPLTTRSIIIKNQPYFTNLIIGNALPFSERRDEDIANNIPIFNSTSSNDYRNITQVYLANIGTSFDSLDLVKRMGGNTAPQNMHLYLEGVYWETTEQEFNELYENKLQYLRGYDSQGSVSDDYPAYISGTLVLTGNYTYDFINTIANAYEGRLQIYYRENEELKQFYAVKFYDSVAKTNLLRTEFVAGGTIKEDGTVSGGIANYQVATLFNEEYIVEYNIKNYNWKDGDEIRYAANEWEWTDHNGKIKHGTQVSGVIDEVEAYPYLIPQYCLNQVIQKEDYRTQTIYSYFYEGATIRPIDMDNYAFVRDYYSYSLRHWTFEGPSDYNNTPSYQEGDMRPNMGSSDKLPRRETIYAVYTRTPATYEITVYNTDKDGLPKNPLFEKPLYRSVISGGSYSTVVTQNDLLQALGKSTSELVIAGDENIENSLYRFNNWKPYIPNDGLIVTGKMDIYATYYKTDDIFNCYFLNKLVNCDLVTLGRDADGQKITELPEGAFSQNTNLLALRTEATQIGNTSFVNFSDLSANTAELEKRVFIFTGENITFDRLCFYGAKDCIIIFTGEGQIRVNTGCFNMMRNCDVVVLNSSEPIRCASSTMTSNTFSQFSNQTEAANQNRLYVVSSDVRLKYRYGEDFVPDSFKNDTTSDKVATNVQVFNRESDNVITILNTVRKAGYDI